MSRSGPKLGARWMEEQFHLMSAKLCWHRACVRRAARTMLGITSRCRRHSCSSSGTSSRQCWLSFQATPLPASPLWGEVGVTAGPQSPEGPGGSPEEGEIPTHSHWMAAERPSWHSSAVAAAAGRPMAGNGAGMGTGMGTGAARPHHPFYSSGGGGSCPPGRGIKAVSVPFTGLGTRRGWRGVQLSLAVTVPKQHLGGGWGMSAAGCSPSTAEASTAHVPKVPHPRGF